MNQRNIATGQRGMVASAHPTISSSGIQMLRMGGNAMDAAIAMALTSDVIFPDMCGLGGDAFFLYYDASVKKVFAIEGSGHSGEHYDINFFKQLQKDTIDEHGPHSISVPGAVSAYFLGLREFGSKSFRECALDAIFLSEQGFLVSSKLANYIEKHKQRVSLDFDLASILFDKHGQPKKFGDIIVQTSLAKTLKRLSEGDERVFYNDLSSAMVESLNRKGNKLTCDDFAHMVASIKQPISIRYQNHTIFQLPPISQGVVHLETLAILDHVPIHRYPPNSAMQIHHMVEAKKLAFTDRILYFGDPEYVENPIDFVLSKDHTRQLSEKINSDSCLNIDDLFKHSESHTTSMVVIDEWGNACSFIHSISDVFGSGIMCPQTGIIFNNRQGTNFNLSEGHPNRIQPRKKTMSTLITYMIFNEADKLRFIGNTPGGDNQPQWNTQTIVNLLNYGMRIDEALDQPRWFDAQTSNPQNKFKENILTIESSVGQSVIDQLKCLGHKVDVVTMCSGASQLIEVDSNGRYQGVSDPRAEGIAIGY